MALSYDFTKLNALVVEDSKFMREIMKAILTGLEFNSVHYTMDLFELRQIIVSENINVVFTDWELGSFTGKDVVRKIRKSKKPTIAMTPVIAMSAHTDIDIIKKMLSTGVDDVMVKPIAPRTIYSRLTRLIEEPPSYVRGPDYLGPKRNIPQFA